MQRLLAVLFTVTFTAAGAAAPAIACVTDDIAASKQHACCGQQPVVTAPVGLCCTVSLPPGRALVEVRPAAAKHDALDRVVARAVSWFTPPHNVDRTSHHELHPHSARSVPIYLEQLTLLI